MRAERQGGRRKEESDSKGDGRQVAPPTPVLEAVRSRARVEGLL